MTDQAPTMRVVEHETLFHPALALGADMCCGCHIDSSFRLKGRKVAQHYFAVMSGFLTASEPASQTDDRGRLRIISTSPSGTPT